MSKRPQQRVERRYIVEYVEKTYPTALARHYNLRLGTVADEHRASVPNQPAAFFRVTLPYADAVVVTENEILVLEAKVYEPEKGIGQLRRYARLIPATDDLKIWGSRPIRTILVTWRSTFPLIEDANANGVQMVIFLPEWLIPILQQRGLM